MKLVYAKHPQVGHGEGSTADVIKSQTAFAGSPGQVFDLTIQVVEGLRVSLLDGRNDEAVWRSSSHSHVDLVEEVYDVPTQGSVHKGMLAQGTSHCVDDERRVGVVLSCSCGHCHIHFDGEGDVRSLLRALLHALGDDAAQWGERHFSARDCDRRSGGPLALLESLLYLAYVNPVICPPLLDLRQIQAVLFGQAASGWGRSQSSGCSPSGGLRFL